MKILVVGSGAREHTFVWKIVQSPLVEKVHCVPGNPGIAQIAECQSIPLEDNFSAIADFAENEKIDLTVVGPKIRWQEESLMRFKREDSEHLDRIEKPQFLKRAKISRNS